MVRSHRLVEFDVDAVYNVVRDNLLYFLATLLQSWGDCIDKVLYDIAKKRTRVAKVASFFARCDEDYVARAIYVLDKYVPSKTKVLFLDATFDKYVTIVRPWIIRELRKKRPKGKRQRVADVVIRKHLLLAFSFLIDAASYLFRYKDMCIASEVNYILSVTKKTELMLLKRVRSKTVYQILSSRNPILGTLSRHNDAVDNIRQSACRSDDAHIKKFAIELIDTIVADPAELQRHLIRAVKRI